MLRINASHAHPTIGDAACANGQPLAPRLWQVVFARLINYGSMSLRPLGKVCRDFFQDFEPHLEASILGTQAGHFYLSERNRLARTDGQFSASWTVCRLPLLGNNKIACNLGRCHAFGFDRADRFLLESGTI
ncbi:hypothetical protein HNQ59_003148 [Chitinivorax tropicus]|uniref:Uncharacterized protein n=1 Tax=Chitinivorax tropicus TaxID=714531 RepID=A0A840MN46_9PROT|nr:hypothetical protein [Chitinivorax tropicus]MBB5019840.1 hypothetical protein [Chitinivorax tropicus]